MNNLKKTLFRDDAKKYQNKKVNNTVIVKNSKTNHWTDINQLIQCRSTLKKNVELSINQSFKKIIQETFQNNSIKNLQDLIVKLIQKYEFYYPVDHEESLNMSKSKIHNQYQKKLTEILEVLHKMNQNQQNSDLKMKNQIKICYNEIDRYLKQITKKRKQKELQDYQNIISILKPTKKKEGDHTNKQKQKEKEHYQKNLKKLMSSLSSNNLHVKVTQEQFSIKNPQLSKKKSEGALKSYSKGKQSNNKNLNQGELKLQNFLKDPTVKLVKTKIEYDYSAILEGSRSNIHPRNKTYIQQTQTNKQRHQKKQQREVTNMNKVKKNQAFVFYRPKPKQ